MHTPYVKPITKQLVFIGALLWIVAGFLLALRPSGHPPTSFRYTADLVPLLAIGLLLIGIPTGTLMYQLAKRKDRLLKIGCALTVVGSGSYVVGCLLRIVFLNAVGWEPFLPLGFLVFIAGNILIGIALVRKPLYFKATGWLFVLSGIFLLLYNDQYTPWMAIPFGLSILVILRRIHLYGSNVIEE